MKKSFVFFETWAEAIRQMPDKERLQVFDAIMAYGIYGEKTEIGGLAQMALNLVFNDIDDCKKKRNEKTEKARESANKRWQKTNADECERIRTQANAYERKQTDAGQCYNVNVNGNVNEDENVNGSLLSAEKSAQNKKPTKKQKTAIDIEPIIAELPSVIQNIARMWVDYKRQQFGFSYKSEKSFELWLNDLYKKSNGDVEAMKAIVENSIANGYQGIFEPKKTYNNGNNGTSNRTIQERAERIAEYAFAANGLQNG